MFNNTFFVNSSEQTSVYMDNKDLSKALKITMEQPMDHIADILVSFWGKWSHYLVSCSKPVPVEKQPWKKEKRETKRKAMMHAVTKFCIRYVMFTSTSRSNQLKQW